MEEYLRRSYLKEEEFLADFESVARAAARIMAGDWQPNPSCDDQTRQQRARILKSGRLAELVFHSAAVYEDASHAFASAQIILQSSKGLVSVRVRDCDGTLIAEKVFDRPT